MQVCIPRAVGALCHLFTAVLKALPTLPSFIAQVFMCTCMHTHMFLHSHVCACVWISNQSILKEISPEYSLEGLMLKLKLQYFGHPMRRPDSLEKTLMLGKIEARTLQAVLEQWD